MNPTFRRFAGGILVAWLAVGLGVLAPAYLAEAPRLSVTTPGATPSAPIAADEPAGGPGEELLELVLAEDAAASPDDPLDARIASLQHQVRSGGPAPAALEQLGWAFVEKSRTSGDHGYYVLAEQCARAMRAAREEAAEAPDADLLAGHALHALHRFAEAERVAGRLVARRGSPLDFALYGDTLLDQGRLDEAVAAYERMMQRRPDSRAYSRVAEVRLLTGDLDGAREAMRTAARAVSARDREAFAWTWSRLAMLELQSGRPGPARRTAEIAVQAAPGSPVAEAAYGRILLAAGESAAAIAPLERAVARAPLADTMRALADAYAGAGRHESAARALAELEAGGTLDDPRGFSVWLAETGRHPARALGLAEAELERRRDVYTYDALAVASLAAGRTDDARRHMASALAAGTQDPRLWYHAGLVAAAHDARQAREWFLKAKAGEQMLLPSLRRDLDERLAAIEACATKSRPGSSCPNTTPKENPA